MRNIDGQRLQGAADERIDAVVAGLERHLAADPHLSFQAVAFHHGRPVLDVWAGEMAADSMVVPFSATKNTIGITIGLLIERGLLDLDERVAHYWPEFAARRKDAVTVRQLLSHQAGVPQATPGLSRAELLDDHAAARRLADTSPFWYPGSAFGYHALTIGNLASELVHRITGRTLKEYYESEIRAPHDIDFFLGLPSEHEGRRLDAFPAHRPVGDPRELSFSPLTLVTFADIGAELVNEPSSWRSGHPAAYGVGSARGLARLLAVAVTGVDGADALFGQDTVDLIGQQQVRGYDEVLAADDRAFAIVFQKPWRKRRFGGPRAFGHDGGGGALACVDPDTGVAFAWTTTRGPWPGGADPRAADAAREIGELLAAATD
ncbi:serine hydrolase domain-containing protein [Microbacterium sp. NPDC089320]|uniref:serine hydrolase domain-containing protein n=1 Tax=Microbacterium sp. NPDC089320 TaxID=3155182 RepID=UPI0034427027